MLVKPLLFAAGALFACGPSFEVEAAEDLRGATATEGPKRTKATAAPAYALLTTDAQDPAVWKTSFPIYSTYTLYLATEITGTLTGHHLASVYLIAPGSTMYQRLDTAFATDVLAGPDEQQAVKTSTGWRVWVSVPVAGTSIQQLNMAGTWTSEVWIDSAAVPNAKTSFVLN